MFRLLNFVSINNVEQMAATIDRLRRERDEAIEKHRNCEATIRGLRQDNERSNQDSTSRTSQLNKIITKIEPLLFKNPDGTGTVEQRLTRMHEKMEALINIKRTNSVKNDTGSVRSDRRSNV
jgi:hypothetical protein